MSTNTALAADPKIHKELFLYYLNKIHDGKLYLRDNLEKVISSASLKILKLALEELLHDVVSQIKRMDEIYTILAETPSKEFDAPMKAMIQNACDHRNNADTVIVNDMDIMVHMQLVEHVNIISYRMLIKLAGLLGYTEIKMMLQECFDESRDDDKLFYEVAKEYLGA